MPLYYITGNSGTGKSTVLNELKRRGYEAYDVDVAGPVTAKWHNNITGYIHPKSSIKKEDRTWIFLKMHSWRVRRQEVEELTKQANHKTIFLGGTISNIDKVSDLFKRTFALVVDNDTLKQRLQTRANNDWGKSPHELKMTLNWNKNAVVFHKKKGQIIVDSAQSVKKVVDEILSHVHES